MALHKRRLLQCHDETPEFGGLVADKQDREDIEIFNNKA